MWKVRQYDWVNVWLGVGYCFIVAGIVLLSMKIVALTAFNIAVALTIFSRVRIILLSCISKSVWDNSQRKMTYPHYKIAAYQRIIGDILTTLKDRAHLSTFKIFIFEKFSCSIVPVVFLVIVQSSELLSVWFCEKMTFFPNFFSYHILAIYVGGASLGLPTACRLIAVSGARLPSVDGLVVRCIKMHHHVKSAITICLQFI